ncbi:MAG: IS1595 family transposase [Sarcina sp.]
MASVESIMNEINKLDISAESIIYNILEERKVTRGYTSDVINEVKENRFSKGKCCPHCENNSICRNGKYDNKQRYFCKACKKTFTDFTHSPSYNSKKPLDMWIKYVKCMIAGYSLIRCAQEVGISLPTSFYWRHKILDGIKKFLGNGSVGGIVECDDTFFRESFKGHHTENSVFKMPRKGYKRGVKSDPNVPVKEKKKRGLSKDQISVMCAIDRSGNIISEPIGRGKINALAIAKLFEDKIEEDSIACTDSCRSFKKFAKNSNLQLVQLPKGKKKAGIYHLQHVNSFHSKLKGWMKKFNGVATKYLSSYLSWFRWLEYFKAEKDFIKVKNLLVHSHIKHSTTKINEFICRQVNF